MVCTAAGHGAGRGRGARVPHRLGAARLPRDRRGLRRAAAGRAASTATGCPSRSSRRRRRPRSASTTRTSPTTRSSATVGADTAGELRDLTLRSTPAPPSWPRERGIILADTKFEFGRDAASGGWCSATRCSRRTRRGSGRPTSGRRGARSPASTSSTSATGCCRTSRAGTARSGDAAAPAARGRRGRDPRALRRGLRAADRPARSPTGRRATHGTLTRQLTLYVGLRTSTASRCAPCKLLVVIASTRPGRVGQRSATGSPARPARTAASRSRSPTSPSWTCRSWTSRRTRGCGATSTSHTSEWSAQVEAADAVVFVMPEYNYSLHRAAEERHRLPAQRVGLQAGRASSATAACPAASARSQVLKQVVDRRCAWSGRRGDPIPMVSHDARRRRVHPDRRSWPTRRSRCSTSWCGRRAGALGRVRPTADRRRE